MRPREGAHPRLRAPTAAFLLLLLAGCTVTRTVPGGAMAPTIPPGSTIGVDLLAFGPRGAVPRWTVVLHEHDDSVYVRRVLGLPFERVQWDATGYRVNGRPLVAPQHVPASFDDPVSSLPAYQQGDVLLGADEYFMGGDFGSDSADSRFHGPFPFESILGRVTSVNGTPLP